MSDVYIAFCVEDVWRHSTTKRFAIFLTLDTAIKFLDKHPEWYLTSIPEGQMRIVLRYLMCNSSNKNLFHQDFLQYFAEKLYMDIFNWKSQLPLYPNCDGKSIKGSS